MQDQGMIAPCGLYCGVCGVMIANRDGNEKFKEKLAGFYGVSPNEITCMGCMSDTKAVFCEVCHIRSCNQEKGYEGCYQCDEWPCQYINEFPVPVGKKVIMRAIPQWRELGTEKWVEEEKKRYLCPSCGYELFRGAKNCRNCKTEVDLD